MRISILFIMVGLFFSACDSDNNLEEIINPPTEMSFQVEKTNSENNFSSNVQSFDFKQKSSHWTKTTEGDMSVIVKEILYDVSLENGEVIEFGLWFAKFDGNEDLLNLELDGPNEYHGSNWDYISSETEATDFYSNCEIRILVNNNVIFTHANNEDLNIIEVNPVIVDGEEKSFLAIDFYGSARGWYDPEGIYQPVYELVGGYFEGVVE